MSQDYFESPGSSKSRQPRTPETPDRAPRHRWERPNYMAVGSGSTSENAQRLTAMLDQDSGYGSIADDESANGKWDVDHLTDRPTPLFSPLAPGAAPPRNETDRRTVQSHVHQLHYNHNRTALARAITRVTDSLRRLQEYNREWPAHYPSVPSPVSTQHGRSDSNSHSPTSPRLQRFPDVRPGLVHTQSSLNDRTAQKSRPSAVRRADTTVGDGVTQAESSNAAAQRPVQEPRLITPQLARDFSVLKIDLKMDGMAQTEIIHSLRKDSKALAQLLDGQINKSLRHLAALRERIEDTSSKVLVTGDLNAGKSTFCNALLRRKILPEDEQPCTSIFCEVLDVRENGGIEEVHAIPIGFKYDRKDERTYEVHPLEKLEKIVTDGDKYSQCKVYIKDVRTVDQSLLNNGVLDIALIDAPGLNNDSLKTTAVFARQEEIDVVVFVVSAADHFTLSAREFIYDAAREKAYIFMVVNGFDAIKNKERCQEQILKQVARLSPATFKESSELVHFVSSNAIAVSPLAPTSGSSGGSSGPPDDAPDSNPNSEDSDNDSETKYSPESSESGKKGKGKEKDLQRRDFAALESSLRRFILEKRARSKLAPAKTYLINLLDDINSLATVNAEMAENELKRVDQELSDLQPSLESSQKARDTAGTELDEKTEAVANGVYEHTRTEIETSIAGLGSRAKNPNLTAVEYPGFWDAFAYSQDLLSAMLSHLSTTVAECEDHARAQTTEGVNMIKSLGLLHLGDEYTDLTFNSDRMYRKRRDALARQVDVDVDIWDFFDVSSLLARHEKAVGSGMAVTVAGMVGGQLVGTGVLGWVDGALGAARILGSRGVRTLIVPGMLLGVILTTSYLITQIPHTLPKRLSSKLSLQLQSIDFTHSNAQRLSTEVRKALKIPSDNLRIGLQRNLEGLKRTRDEKSKVKLESEVARKWFSNLVRESEEVRTVVGGVDLDAGNVGDAV